MSGAALVVVGDAVLDVDIEGTATRLSPEAPVPVVDVQRRWQRPGGAGLAALLAARTDDDVVLVTAIADDAAGQQLSELLAAAGVRVIALSAHGTTVTKTRVRARGQSVLRIDHGALRPDSGPVPDDVTEVLARARAVCVADYGGGVAAHAGLRRALAAVADRVPIVWDPHPRGAQPIPGCRLVTPNDAEARQFCGVEAPSGDMLRATWKADAVCVTLGAGGARVFAPDRAHTHIGIPALSAGSARADTCGAGDRFAVAATAALGAGADALSAVSAAVDAAARFVAAGGAAAVASPVPDDGGALTGADSPDGTSDVVALADRLRAQGRTVVATGGCFDLLHTGHVRLLRTARQHGDALIVLLNSDDSVRTLKGPGRPVMPAADRARVLAALACVDAVAVFSEETPERLIGMVQPDIWVKGGDYAAEDLPEAEVVRRHGGDVVIVPTVAGHSTTALIAAARSGQTTTKAMT